MSTNAHDKSPARHAGLAGLAGLGGHAGLGGSAFLALAVLVCFQLAGDALARTARLPLPGAVVGAALLFAAMCARPRLHARVALFSHALLRNMLLFYVPASTGIMNRFGSLVRAGPALTVAVVASTWACALATAIAFDAIARRSSAVRWRA